MNVSLRSILVAALVSLASTTGLQAATFGDYYPMNPDAVTSVTLTNRSSNTEVASSLICDVPWMTGATATTPQLFASGMAAGFSLTALPEQFAAGIPEYIDVPISNSYGGATTHAVNLWLNGVVIDGEVYGYYNGWHGIWVWSPDGTQITLNAWTDQDGSLHLDFYIDDAP